MNQQEVITQITGILSKHCENPAQEIIKMGKVLVEIGEAVQSLSCDEARAVIVAASIMTSMIHPTPTAIQDIKEKV